MNANQILKIKPSLAVRKSVQEAIVADRGLKHHIVIDYSSPNIAKPFHFGHLKSTILGNFLANLNLFCGNEVTRLNYVGDWGTQYGLLSLGLDQDGKFFPSLDENKSNRSMLERLVDIYVEANARASQDEDFYSQARRRFKQMDDNMDTDLISRWRHIRDISLKELKQSYEQLGISFDTYEYESDYSRASRELVEQMKMKGLVKQKHTSDGNSDPIWVAEVIKNDRVFDVPLLKSDGTGLYLTRDIAAALSRQSKYRFDKMLYVVGADQERHFHCLRELVKQVAGEFWANEMIHVKLGKVVGMSSRSGNFVLLSKIIEEATERFIESTMNSPTSKVFRECDIEEVGRQLAMSSLFIYDMRNKRTRNYQFNWDQAMMANDRSGLQLQGTHARLCSLRRKALEERSIEPYNSTNLIDYSEKTLRTEYTQDATDLIKCLNEFSSHLRAAYENMDAHPLVNHAFKLCKTTNRARRSDFMNVLKELNEEIARSRLTLFDCSRDQLELIIHLLGMQPLDRI